MQRKVLILALLLLAGGTLPLRAQTPSVDEGIERGISLYDFGHWVEARTELKNIRDGLSPVTDRLRIERIDYYLALCDAELKMRDVEGRLKRFLAEYHGSSYANDVQFALGAYYCMQDDTALAEEELAKVHYEALDPQNKDKYDLRMGYMAFMRGDFDSAERYFGRIKAGSDYADHATYYKSYMAYAHGDYERARNGFNSLLRSPLYRDLMPYYLLQIDFKSGDYRAVVDKGDALIERTTAEQGSQIRRMMAESWFQIGDYDAATRYLSLIHI